jgi:hypothetical protein
MLTSELLPHNSHLIKSVGGSTELLLQNLYFFLPTPHICLGSKPLHTVNLAKVESISKE